MSATTGAVVTALGLKSLTKVRGPVVTPPSLGDPIVSPLRPPPAGSELSGAFTPSPGWGRRCLGGPREAAPTPSGGSGGDLSLGIPPGLGGDRGHLTPAPGCAAFSSWEQRGGGGGAVLPGGRPGGSWLCPQSLSVTCSSLPPPAPASHHRPLRAFRGRGRCQLHQHPADEAEVGPRAGRGALGHPGCPTETPPTYRTAHGWGTWRDTSLPPSCAP